MLTIEFVILLGWGVLVLGFCRRDYTITSISSMYLMIVGTWILGSDPIGLTQLMRLGVGVLHIGIGFYVLLRGSTETYKGKSFKKPIWLGFKKKAEEKMTEENKEHEEDQEEEQEESEEVKEEKEEDAKE